MNRFYTPATNPPPIGPRSIDPSDLWSLDESVAVAYADEETDQ